MLTIHSCVLASTMKERSTVRSVVLLVALLRFVFEYHYSDW